MTVLLAVVWSSLAAACSCIPPGSPSEELAGSSDVFVGRVLSFSNLPSRVVDDRLPPVDGGRRFRFEVLASWKGAKSDTLSVVTAGGSAACGYEFMREGVYLVYADRDKDGVARTSICSRTRPIYGASEDSVALGPPSVDRMKGASWIAFAPPATCPVHKGTAIKWSYEWPAADLTPDARREYPAWAAREAPYAGMPLAPIEWKGGSLDNAFVCPVCREIARAWVAVSQERSTGPESWDLAVAPGKVPSRSEADYRREYPREQFAFSYDDGRNDYDAIESRFQRNYGSVRDTMMKFDLSPAELDRLYEVTVTSRLMDLSTPHPQYPEGRKGAVVRADRAQVLFVRCGIFVRQFSWYAERAPKDPAAESEWGRLLAVYREAQRVLAARPEVSALTPIPIAFDDALRDVR